MRRTLFALTIAGLSVAAFASPPPGGGPPAPLSVEVVNADPIPVMDYRTREQYEVTATFSGVSCGGTNCSNFNLYINTIEFELPAVPTGKRWVISHVSGRLPYTTTEASFALQTQQVVVLGQQVKAAFFGPFFPNLGGNMIGFSTEVLTSYGPGEIPHINLSSASAPNNYIGFITVSGYLIDAP